MEDIIDIVLKVLALLLGAGLGYLGKLAVSYIKSKLTAQQAAELDTLIGELVAAAEQMYKAGDNNGSIRYDYVVGRLRDLGYAVTKEVNDLIESNVLKVNLAVREANK